MKTWEMIKQLTENPNKEFKRELDGLHIKTNEDGELIWDNGYQFIRLDHEWKEIKKPVSFMEAVASGKRIKLEHEDGGEKYVTLDYFLASISGRFMQNELRDLLLRGTFYVKS